MLSTNKVKLHGMSDHRWTVRDKLSQYKGLVNLYKRDSKILQQDLNVLKRNKVRMLKQISKDIVTSRKSLDNAIGGDKQNLRNALQEHKDLQLAYQHLDPEKVVENIHQSNFNQRKVLDRIKFQMKLRTNNLIDKKLVLANLEDREIYADLFAQLPTERQAQTITGKVQDAILKQEAAISVKYTYKKILDLLKKDTYYFDAVLSALELDLKNQTQCIYRTTELGQIATENLDDRKRHLIELKHSVKIDKEKMMHSIDIIKKRIKLINKNVKSIIRRDSDINIPLRSIAKTSEDNALLSDLEQFEVILAKLQQILLVHNYDSLFPCLQTQRRHQAELEIMVDKLDKACKTLSNKKNHAEIRLTNLMYSMVEATLTYMEKKKEITKDINLQKDEYNKLHNKILDRGKLAVQIRASLQQLFCQLNQVSMDTEKKQVTLEKVPFSGMEDTNEIDIMKQIRLKTQRLITVDILDLKGREEEDAKMAFTNMITRTCNIISITEQQDIEDIMESLVLEDANVLTRADIKKQSQEIVDYYIALEQEMFLPQPVKKKR